VRPPAPLMPIVDPVLERPGARVRPIHTMMSAFRPCFRPFSIAGICAAGVLTLAVSARAQSDPRQEPAVAAVHKTMGAVVNINTERVVLRPVQDPIDAFYEQFFGGTMRPSRAVRQTQQSLGSGLIVDPTGFIITNEHVVERAAEMRIAVTTTDGKTWQARYITGDPESDLALIKIDSPTPLPFIDLNKLSPNLLGQTVLALGNPLGYGSSVTRGILSAANRTLTVGDQEFQGLLQTDVAINPGNSGGPLVDLSGNLIGVSSVKMAYTPQGVPTQGIGFAIPGHTVLEWFQRARTESARPRLRNVTAARQRFGLQLQELTDELADALRVPRGKGVLVSGVEENSPAALAGMTRGLVTYQIGRFEVSSVKPAEELLSQAGQGEPVDLTVGYSERGTRGVRTLTYRLIAR